MKISATFRLLFILLVVFMVCDVKGDGSMNGVMDSSKHPLVYINTNFENASQLDWEVDAEEIVQVSLIYDHERSSPNRANGHWHFQMLAERGSDITVQLNNFENVWNGIKGVPISEKTNTLISEDGKNWRVITADLIDENKLRFKVHMESDKIYVASVEPYRISDLEKFISEIKNNPLIEVSQAGHTAEGRPLEMIRVGKADAPFRVVLRARAHSWEPGGNWVVQGFVRSFLQDDAAKYRDRYCVYIMPMANKDGVARGRTRFNTLGKDLNREWHLPADKVLTPEKYALESWLQKMIDQGKKPHLAIDLHNDRGGNLHVNLPTADNQQYTSNLKRFENLLFKHTWFREGFSHVKNPGSFGEGMLARFGIDACVYELNYEWAKGLNKEPLGKDWELLGKQLRVVFYEYFENKK
ncbi:MAG: M14-type cytosolic carboxypeptidase [Cyclobacteriaceae bacterium]